MRIAIASDHAAVALKAALAAWLRDAGHDVLDLGPHDTASVDYPDYGYELADATLTTYTPAEFDRSLSWT